MVTHTDAQPCSDENTQRPTSVSKLALLISIWRYSASSPTFFAWRSLFFYKFFNLMRVGCWEHTNTGTVCASTVWKSALLLHMTAAKCIALFQQDGIELLIK